MDNGIEEAAFIENEKTLYTVKLKQKAGKQEMGLNIIKVCKLSQQHLVVARKNKTLELINLEDLNTLFTSKELEEKVVGL